MSLSIRLVGEKMERFVILIKKCCVKPYNLGKVFKGTICDTETDLCTAVQITNTG